MMLGGSRTARCAGVLMLTCSAMILAALAADRPAESSPASGVVATAPHGVELEPWGDDPDSTWSAPQFVQADAEGRVFLLRGDTLEVFPVSSAGRLEAPTRLQVIPPPPPPHIKGKVVFEVIASSAAMGSTGGDWILQAFGRLYRFRAGKEEPVQQIPRELHGVGATESLALWRGEVVVNILGRQPPRGPDHQAPPPLVMILDQDRWMPLTAAAAASGAIHEAGSNVVDQESERSLRMAADSAGNLWLAHRYAYRLLRIDAVRKPHAELRIGDGAVAHVQGEQGRLDKAFENAARVTSGVELHPSDTAPLKGLYLPREVIHGLAAGRDGRVYLLAEATGKNGALENKGLVLDRFDPVRRVLERLQVELTIKGPVSMAAAADGLYLAGFSGNSGRWRIGWERLNGAPWQPVQAVMVE